MGFGFLLWRMIKSFRGGLIIEARLDGTPTVYEFIYENATGGPENETSPTPSEVVVIQSMTGEHDDVAYFYWDEF